MKSTSIRLAALTLLVLVLSACQNTQVNDLKRQNAQLQAQTQTLQKQLNDAQVQVAKLQAAQTAASSTSASESDQMNALKSELAWRQAQGYAVAVHAAFLGRMAEDPMYTPERLTGEVADCTKAKEVGDRAFGQLPTSVTSCTVEPDGDNDVRVTVKTGGKTFVNGVEGGL